MNEPNNDQLNKDALPYCICGDCRFWKRGGVGGHCHRYPPTKDSFDNMNGFPFTSGDTWCGEWKEKESKS